MKRNIPDWLIQLVWFLAGVYGTGALWYFLSRDDILSSTLSLAGAAILTFVAVQLIRLNDRSTRFKVRREKLADFMKEAEVLQNRSTEEPLPIQEHNDWVTRVEEYLKEQLDSSYVARLSNFNGMTFFGGSDYKNSLIGRSARLHEFITEFSE